MKTSVFFGKMPYASRTRKRLKFTPFPVCHRTIRSKYKNNLIKIKNYNERNELETYVLNHYDNAAMPWRGQSYEIRIIKRVKMF